MLEMVRGLAHEMGVEAAWHTGSVPQLQRRAEINRFRENPACRMFLTSDAGATGLNLQTANCIINLDLPWNPAKLEQRIARIWRKGQKRAITAINFVTENSIEHSILHLLAHKQNLADGVLDGAEDFSAIKMPSGRAALIERMQAMLEGRTGPAKIREVTPEQALIAGLSERHGARFHHAELRAERLFLVLDGDTSQIAEEKTRIDEMPPAGLPPIELIDRAAWEMLQRLAGAGIVQFSSMQTRILHQAQPAA